MNDLLSTLASPVWWVSAAAAIVLANMLGTRGKPVIAKVCARFSPGARLALGMEAEHWRTVVNRICDDPQYEAICTLREARHRAKGMLYGLAGVCMLGLGLTFSVLLYSFPQGCLQARTLCVQSWVALFCTAGMWVALLAGVAEITLGFTHWARAGLVMQQVLEGRAARLGTASSVGAPVPSQLSRPAPLP